VHEILLLPFGGVSKLERLRETAADEFAVAIGHHRLALRGGAVA
jgi:hypothetical protein